MESPIRPFFWQSGEQSLAVGNTSSTEGTRVRQKWATHYAVTVSDYWFFLWCFEVVNIHTNFAAAASEHERYFEHRWQIIAEHLVKRMRCMDESCMFIQSPGPLFEYMCRVTAVYFTWVIAERMFFVGVNYQGQRHKFFH